LSYHNNQILEKDNKLKKKIREKRDKIFERDGEAKEMRDHSKLYIILNLFILYTI